MFNAKMKAIEVYHGERIETNDFYIQHFKERGKDVEHFLRDVVGRDKRYLIDPEKENSLTMAVNASKKALDKAGLTGADLDMIIFSSQLAEYTAPPCSIKLHYALEGKQDCICFDMNANCIGMTAALDLSCKYLSTTPSIHYVLIVGSDYINMMLNPENELCYGHYGDAACAVILEKTDEDCGMLDSHYYVESDKQDLIEFPKCGFSHIFEAKDKEDILLKWNKTPPTALDPIVENIQSLIKRNGLKMNDIKMFLFSQYVLKNIESLRKLLEIDEAHNLYIGDKYGYTGTSSPFIVLYECIQRGLVKRGDYLFFWTMGAGSEKIFVLFKY